MKIRITTETAYVNVSINGKRDDIRYLIGKEIARHFEAGESGYVNVCLNFEDTDGEIKPIRELIKKKMK